MCTHSNCSPDNLTDYVHTQEGKQTVYTSGKLFKHQGSQIDNHTDFLDSK